MPIPLRQFVEDRPGRAAVITLALFAPVAIAIAILVIQTGGTFTDVRKMVLLVYTIASWLVGVPAISAGLLLSLFLRFGALGRYLMCYGAILGALGFGALLLFYL